MKESTTNVKTYSIDQCKTLLAQADLYLPAIINTLYNIHQPPSTVSTVSTQSSKFGYAASRPFAIIYAVIVSAVMLLVLLQLKIAQTKEKSNDSVAQGHSLATGQVPEGAASEARL
jgi:hypothetical protein